MRTPTRLISVLLLVIPLGCSPRDYERGADRDVERILDDRKRSVLDYEQPTPIEPTEPEATRPAKPAYEPVPVTALAPREPPIILPADEGLKAGPLGPEVPAYMPGEEPPDDLFGIRAQLRQEAEQFAYGPPAPLQAVERLDLFGAVRYAVQHSRAYQTRSETVYLTALDVTLERHLFTPRPFARSTVGFTGGRLNDVDYRSALTATQSLGVRQQLPYGGEVVAEGLVEFVDALRGNAENAENAELVLRGSVPLLRGAGMVNLEPLIQSEREVVYAIRDFESYRREFFIQVATRYFGVVNDQIGLANLRYNYGVGAGLTRRTQELYEAGRISFQQVQRALQSQLRTERQLIRQQDAYRTRLDEFKIVIGMPVETELEIVPIELVLRAPEDQVADAVDKAVRYRLDLQTARDRIEDAQRSVQVAQNGLLPDLDVTGDYRVGNPDDAPGRDVRGRTGRYSAGVALDLPLDRVAERNFYRRSLIGFQRAQRQYEETRERIGVDARDALRSIRSAEMQVVIADAGIRLARQRLEYFDELLKDGRADARDVVEAQQALLEAQDSYDDARTSLQISILDYYRETGTLRVDPDAGTIGLLLN